MTSASPLVLLAYRMLSPDRRQARPERARSATGPAGRLLSYPLLLCPGTLHLRRTHMAAHHARTITLALGTRLAMGLAVGCASAGEEDLELSQARQDYVDTVNGLITVNGLTSTSGLSTVNLL